MKPIVLPKDFNYIGVFLTFACQLKCPYCINRHGTVALHRPKQLTGDQWIEGLSRIQATNDLPLTLQGGEPTLHTDFFQIVNSLQPGTLDLLTNLEVDAEEFMRHIHPHTFHRKAKYASIRVSYHFDQTNYAHLMHKVADFMKKGYDIGVWEIDHPDYTKSVLDRQHAAKHWGIDYRIKEFLGPWKGRNYGTMAYSGAVGSNINRSCDCKTSEFLIAPDGNIYRCHSDLYAGLNAIGHILSPRPLHLGEFRPCNRYGQCNACDIKITTNRFQEYGHSSVEIKNIKHTPTTSDSASA